VVSWRDRLLPIVTLIEAADALGVTADSLRQAANRRLGDASGHALAARLGVARIGRDWLIPRDRLLAELERRS
jgi:hypothetical protein